MEERFGLLFQLLLALAANGVRDGQLRRIIPWGFLEADEFAAPCTDDLNEHAFTSFLRA
jgi:hypothetical protein